MKECLLSPLKPHKVAACKVKTPLLCYGKPIFFPLCGILLFGVTSDFLLEAGSEIMLWVVASYTSDTLPAR
jgi:hypothetical protein